MNDNNQNLDKILEKALGYLDRGKSPAEILRLFPEHQEALKEIFFAINLFKKEKESIIPPKELLERIIEQIPDGVTNETDTRYLYKKEVEGRPSLINIITKIRNLMTINWKVWAPLGIVAAVALVIGFSQFGIKLSQAPIAEETSQTETQQAQDVAQDIAQELPIAVTKPATGNVDDAVNAILAGVSDDQALFASVEKDAELIIADSQALSDFGQSYNENEL